ncbi:MAG: hypothetical protein AAF571_13615, partial [Verrucomicrobiota bacterium]
MSEPPSKEDSQQSPRKVSSLASNVFRKLAGAIKKHKPEEQEAAHKPQAPIVNIAHSPQQTANMKENIKKLWGATLSPTALPGATIKISSLAPRPSLPAHIPPRQFALPQQSKAAKSDYMVLEKIADGGMGSVFIGEQSSLKRRVAIKTIKEDAINDEEASSQFL